MTVLAKAIGLASTLLLLTTLVGLVVRGHWRAWYSYALYVLVLPLFTLLYLADDRLYCLSEEGKTVVLGAGDTFVDFEQGVNFAVKQVREALGDVAESPVYIQTVPKRGYRFLAPVEAVTPGGPARPASRRTDLTLHKQLWANIAELRLLEERRQRRLKIGLTVGLVAALHAMSHSLGAASAA